MSHYMTALAMKQRGLKPSAKIVLYWLADHHNEETGLCFPSLKTLADECEMNKTTLIRHLDALEDLGLIQREKRDRENGSRASNSYRLTLSQVSEHRGPSCETQPPPVAKRNHPSCKTQQALVAKRNSHTNLGNTNLGIEPSLAHRDAAGECVQQDLLPTLSDQIGLVQSKSPYLGGLADGCETIDDEFAIVWQHYPRKVDKQDARTAWAKARRTNTFETIVKPLGVFIRVQKGGDISKIPYLTTWLNKKRWEGDQTHARNRAETTADRLRRLGAVSTEEGCDEVAGPTRKPPQIELRMDP
ncbi:helix-turn-helix domain-containing protein [Roseovarius sp. SYSU LYC5161]|uniref:helix-turn-helix domain-containing protein n=1 Tax=Roseovarius halophilus (ex Wu et al. 2025) TaxID=3376060 RepID=UPI00399C3FCA